ncbi:MAG TPA: sulfatase [Thermoanaerobaculia bacterium]|nr:sulfatase [Thermoanaerobaculia bacterium]
MRRSVALLTLIALAACKPRTSPAPDAWERFDLWAARPEIDASPVANRWFRPATQRIAFLGAAEVRDMSRVPPAQLVHFPHRPAGQIRALEQVAGSRVHWRVKLGREPYLSFVPLGFERACACAYRVALRETPEREEELYRAPAEPLPTLAPAAVEIALDRFAGREVDLVFEAAGPAERPAGQPFPSLLWGSPGIYGRIAHPAPRPRGSRPNVLFVGIDTLRADRVGAWGRRPSLTPEMDRLAQESDVFLDTWSAFNVTNPSFVSMMTGLYGKNHGVYDLATPLPRSQRTLASRFHDAGYATMAVISASHLQDVNSGLGQGFDEVTRATEHFAGELATDMTMDWLAAHADGEKPFFVWLHLFDPHSPHTPPQPYASGFEPAAAEGLSPVQAWQMFRQPGPRAFVEQVLGAHPDLYDGEVAYLDRQVGRILGFLDSRKLLETTLVVLVADHGENLGEHGVFFRHVGLHDTTTHVPMMIRWPGPSRPGRRIEGLVQTIDLFPTLLKSAGLAVPPQDGLDLRELTGPGRTGRRAVFAEHAGKLGLMVRTAEFQYILSSGNTQFFPDGASLYDVRSDPAETVNLAGRGLPQEAELERLLQRFLADRRRGPRAVPRESMSPEEIRRLEGLGYLH